MAFETEVKKDKILISIGRSYGSGGLSFAHALHDSLGIPLFDKNILDKTASQSNIRKELLEEVDETNGISIPYVCSSSFPFSSSFFSYTSDYLSNENLFSKQAETIHLIAQKGSAIFVGRCSDYVLRDDPCLRSIFVTDRPEVRVETISKRLNIPTEEAKEWMEKADKRRREYYNFYTSRHWGQADNYDICIQLSTIGMECAVQMVREWILSSSDRTIR